MFKDKRLNDVVFPEAHFWSWPDVAWGKKERRVAGQQDIDALRAELRALATALGYEWVPEGKTAAEWRRKDVDWITGLRLDVRPPCPNCDRVATAYAKFKVESEINAGRKKGASK